MIEVDELHSLIRHMQQPITDIQDIFCALVEYPNGKTLRNSTRADRAGALLAACESLIGDESTLPRRIRTIVSADARDRDPVVATYSRAADVIRADEDRFLAILDQ